MPVTIFIILFISFYFSQLRNTEEKIYCDEHGKRFMTLFSHDWTAGDMNAIWVVFPIVMIVCAGILWLLQQRCVVEIVACLSTIKIISFTQLKCFTFTVCRHHRIKSFLKSLPWLNFYLISTNANVVAH